MMQIGFIGLGSMGGAMAPNLLGRFDLTVYNRSASKAAPLVKAGAVLAETPGEAAEGDAVITMLADDAAVEAVTFGESGLVRHLRRGATHISMSTISVALSKRLVGAHREAGHLYVSAPVFGRPEAAAAGKLFIAAAGPKDALAVCQPIFDALGQRTFRFGEEAPQANLIKLSGNFLIASVIESLSEAFALVDKGGVDRKAFLELLTNTLFAAPVYKTYGGMIAGQRYEPAGFSAVLGRKDIALVLDAAEELKVPMGFAALLSERFLTLLAAGAGELDWSGLGRLASRDAGNDIRLAPR
jgi:3-hydroxyisobutyrate dehydrogenase-like beta-hydroxyacid dehydrogenase